ncbi:fumarylacetoacetate hydrolase family protein [Legionella maioricensis]|uniref:Fumarylacetoacetate hydrolase family protein n=1 Tax=Legionella maioricensis TaxID=2896528 RepID=A0A9X2IAE9_9GAMM|nr:fumarylacetoacetate hydrolase family protein [Legionella maioricensis]MCL9683974.1 fumarylacetoacetate hydrolase family protein [Legionella maioricensis]MCL9687981.1 fumarylacetoacetate hydrolase family protein [Legionella maioricensis]
MKLASLKSAVSRDGELCVVNQTLTTAVRVPQIATTLQYALDHWQTVEKKLQQTYQKLNEGTLDNTFAFDPHQCASPLPRAYQWADGSAYVNHVELVRKARGAEMPSDFWTNPLMYQGGSDAFLGPRDPIVAVDEAHGIDFESEVAIITDDVPIGINKKEAEQHIKLLMLVNDVSLRNLIPDELAKGFGFFQSKPASSFSPVAITPDELGSSWDKQRVHLPLLTHLNGQLFGQPNAGIDMTFSFPELIQHAAKTRVLTAGTIIGSGTVSNLDRSQGSSCIAEKRMLEILEGGKPHTSFMRFGDRVRIEMLDKQGNSLFGAIDQMVTHYKDFL